MNKTKKGYIAGALFNEAEVAQRLKEGALLKSNFPHIEWFNPIEQPFNANKSSLPTPEDIFWGDTKEVQECDYFVCDVTNNDPGVLVELGIAWAGGSKIIAVDSDIRRAAANKYDIPSYGMNHYVLGCIQNGGVLVNNFYDALIQIAAYEQESA